MPPRVAVAGAVRVEVFTQHPERRCAFSPRRAVPLRLRKKVNIFCVCVDALFLAATGKKLQHFAQVEFPSALHAKLTCRAFLGDDFVVPGTENPYFFILKKGF